MPVQPHTIEVTVNDTDNSTVKQGAKVYVRNVTKKTTLEDAQLKTTNSSGVALLDLANLPLAPGQTEEYNQGDKILIIAYDGQNHDAFLYTVAGDTHSQTLNLNPVFHQKLPDDQVGIANRLLSILGGNTSGTVAYAKVYNFSDGALIAHLEVPANDSRGHDFGGSRGIQVGQFVVEREASGLIVTAHVL